MFQLMVSLECDKSQDGDTDNHYSKMGIIRRNDRTELKSK